MSELHKYLIDEYLQHKNQQHNLPKALLKVKQSSLTGVASRAPSWWSPAEPGCSHPPVCHHETGKTRGHLGRTPAAGHRRYSTSRCTSLCCLVADPGIADTSLLAVPGPYKQTLHRSTTGLVMVIPSAHWRRPLAWADYMVGTAAVPPRWSRWTGCRRGWCLDLADCFPLAPRWQACLHLEVKETSF